MTENSHLWSLHLPYDKVTWLCWIALAFGGAVFRRWRGVILGQLTVAAIILLLNFRWMQEAMSQLHSGRGDDPKLDIFFIVGIAVHVVVVNIILLPANAIGLLLASLRKRPGDKTAGIGAPPPLPPARGGR